MATSFKQLRAANTNTQGEAGWCLQMARRIVGVAAKYATAQIAFDRTKKRHGASEALPNVAVPVWFDWSKNDDVAFWIPGRGVLGTPLRGKGQRWDSSPQARAKAIGGTYKGWTEDINDVDVVARVAVPAPQPPQTAMPPIGSKIHISIDRTTYWPGTAKVAGTLRPGGGYDYYVRGYDAKYPGRILLYSKSGGGNVAVALYYVNGAKIEGWRQA